MANHDMMLDQSHNLVHGHGQQSVLDRHQNFGLGENRALEMRSDLEHHLDLGQTHHDELGLEHADEHQFGLEQNHD